MSYTDTNLIRKISIGAGQMSMIGLIGVGLMFPNAASAQCRPAALSRLLLSDALHVPARAIRQPLPLIVLLHGSTDTGAEILSTSGLTSTADKHGFVVLAPDGGIPARKGFVWNIPGVATVDGRLPPATARDDVAHIIKEIDELVSTGCVDPKRVYATGMSGGGRMASWLGCVASTRFAAIAPVVGLRAGRPDLNDPAQPDPATCTPEKPVPVMAFAGDADRTNPIHGGGMSYWRYSMDTAAKRWATLNGCRTFKPQSKVAGRFYESRFSHCQDRSDVVSRVQKGGGHDWSVADTEVMWKFLSRYSR